MVVASANPERNVKVQAADHLPVIDLSGERSEVAQLVVKACEEYGFFKVIRHGVPQIVIAEMEHEGVSFFEKPAAEKQQAAHADPANPFGYGCRNIGFNGDMGEVEYLLLPTNPLSIVQTCRSISNDPSKFRSASNEYIEAVRELACKILNLMAEGLRVQDTSYFSKMIRDVESDSVFRINYYPPTPCCNTSVGFGEHFDPQILTILRSNDVGGLQISPDGGVWIPVAPDPAAFCVNVGDVLQAMTNGRFRSVRHRALSNPSKCRMSMAYFAAPALHARVEPPAEMVTTSRPCLYRPFTWGEYKAATISLRLGDTRLDLFRNCCTGVEVQPEIA